MNEEQNMAAPLRCALIDNYDSFTYNLVHLIRELGAEVTVFSNDGFTLAELEPFDKLILICQSASKIHDGPISQLDGLAQRFSRLSRSNC